MGVQNDVLCTDAGKQQREKGAFDFKVNLNLLNVVKGTSEHNSL